MLSSLSHPRPWGFAWLPSMAAVFSPRNHESSKTIELWFLTLFFFFWFLLPKYFNFNWRIITILWWFLPCISMNQPCVPPSWTSLATCFPPHPSGCPRASLYLKKIYIYIYSFLAVLGLRCYMGFSLVAANAGSSLIMMCGRAALVAGHRL